MSDPVDHPQHYMNHPSGIECIQITEHMGFNLGNAIKYVWRADLKGNSLEDLRKAIWYIDREIQKREGEQDSIRARNLEAIKDEIARPLTFKKGGYEA